MARILNVKDLRAQFAEQAKCLDMKCELDCAVICELQEFFRRLGGVEQEYADGLAKLANMSKQRHIHEASRRSCRTSYSTTTIWNTVVGSTLRISEAHSTRADLLTKQLVQRLGDMVEDAHRLHRQCREMLSEFQECVLSDITKLQADYREYASKQMAALEADRQRRRADDKMSAAAQKARSKGKDPNISQRYLRVQNEYASKDLSFANASMMTAIARNNYLVQLAATNSGIAQYFNEEAPDVIDCMSCGFHNSLARSIMMYLSCEEALKSCHGCIVEMLNRNISSLDWRQDKALFLKSNDQCFARPNPISFVPAKDDNEMQIRVDGVLAEQLETGVTNLSSAIEKQRTYLDGISKTLEESEKKLLDLINQKDYDVSHLFTTDSTRQRRVTAPSPSITDSTSTGVSSNNLGSAISVASTACSTPTTSGRMHNTGNSGLTDGASPAGLYPKLRAATRDARIEQEKCYLECFTNFTKGMHKCHVLQAKVTEIRQALNCNLEALTSSISGPIKYGRRVLPTGSTESTLFQPTTPPHSSAVGRTTELFSLQPPSPSSHSMDHHCAPSSRHKFTCGNSSRPTDAVPKTHIGRRVLQVPNVGKPKLFGATIDEYVEAMNQPIPSVLLWCTRMIVRFGLRQVGVFRVSGSQAEINQLKEDFERGIEHAIDSSGPKDIHVTAGLLKLYLRELGEPLVPHSIFHALIACCRENSDVDETARQFRPIIIRGLSKPTFIVMRFLFAFLNHVSEYSEENSMNAYNLAVCFGPSLMPVPGDADAVQYHSVVVEIVNTFITHHLIVFDPLVPGPVYVKHAIPPGDPSPEILDVVSTVCGTQSSHHTLADEVAELAAKRQSSYPYKSIVLDSPHHKSSSVSDLMDGKRRTSRSSLRNDISPEREIDYSGDDLRSTSDSEMSEAAYVIAVAQADFIGSSPNELSFQQGDELYLYRRLNDHWWEGQLSSDTRTRKLVPHLYIAVKANQPAIQSGASDEDLLEESRSDFVQNLLADSSRRDVVELGTDDNQSGDELLNADMHFYAESLNCIDQVSGVPTAGNGTTHHSESKTDSSLDVTSESPAENTMTPSCPPISTSSAPISRLRSGTYLRTSGSSHNVRRPMTTSISSMDSAESLSLSAKSHEASSPNPTFKNSFDKRFGSLRHTVGLPATVPEDESVATDSLSRSSSHVQDLMYCDHSTLHDAHSDLCRSSDVDNQLAEVIRDLTSLERADTRCTTLRRMERNCELRRTLQLPSAKHTPDLVMDLPCIDNIEVRDITSTKSSSCPSQPYSSSADNFAEQGLDTMRKRPDTLTENSAVTIHSHNEMRSSPEDSSTSRREVDPEPDAPCPPMEAGRKISSIAARVAAFEATSQPDPSFSRPLSRPSVAPKPRRN